MVLLYGLAYAVLATQTDQTYTCQHVRPTRILAFFTGKVGMSDRVQSIEPSQSTMLGPIRAEADDAARTVRFRGDLKRVRLALDLMRELDHRRRELKASVRITSPIDSVDTRLSITMKANVPWEVTEAETGLQLQLNVRSHADGTFTLYIHDHFQQRKSRFAFRIKPNTPFRFTSGPDGFTRLHGSSVPKGDYICVEVKVSADSGEGAPATSGG